MSTELTLISTTPLDKSFESEVKRLLKDASSHVKSPAKALSVEFDKYGDAFYLDKQGYTTLSDHTLLLDKFLATNANKVNEIKRVQIMRYYDLFIAHLYKKSGKKYFDLSKALGYSSNNDSKVIEGKTYMIHTSR